MELIFSTFNAWRQKLTGLGGFVSAYDGVDGIIESVQERVGVEVLCLSKGKPKLTRFFFFDDKDLKNL